MTEEASVQGAGMAGVFGGATKGLAGWAVSSIQSRVSYIMFLQINTLAIYLFKIATVYKSKWRNWKPYQFSRFYTDRKPRN